MKVALLTLGCRVNQAESSVIEGTFKENGVTIVSLKENPDYCIVNTCTVTAKSDYNSRQLIRRAARAGAQVIVTGCYSQIKPLEVLAISGVKEVVDINKKYDIVQTLTGKPTGFFSGNYSRSRPFLKVQDGCNFRCSYCSVPLARGKSRSIIIDEIIRRAKIIESKGYNELVLTGIHLGAYGHDLAERSNLNILIKSLLQQTKIFRIRLSSLEINEIDDELIELMQEHRVCEHLHVPLQSGSDEILKLMRRMYTVDYFKRVVDRVFSKVDNISIGTDVLVGFPEEDNEEFSETLAVVNDLPFSYLHIFPFSERPDTEAYKMNNKISKQILKKRIEKISQLNKEKKYVYMKKQINKTLNIIVEDKINETTVTGTSSNYLKIRAGLKRYRKGSVVRVRPTKIYNEILEGIVLISHNSLIL
ncbi:MAG: tRNA (N(6)-L-threonylcarbamoyladenosine(37)-C(2))-methylthiotransferase MtaB [Candidatus Hodarchaeales archaeon]|jgi:threonylcarbamoyladenosine tRNA methylthiotransferase MtaB